MTGGFGFANYATQRKTPSSQAVGAALLQGRQQQGMGQPDAGAAPMAPPSDAALLDEGARRMGAPGQIDDNAHPDDGTHSANAVNIAIGEALTRQGSGYATNPNPFKDRDRAMRLVQQHGLSATEARLLVETGGL